MTDDEEVDINTIFDNIALTEEKLSQQSYEEGFQDGIKQGNLEGYQLGYIKGIELGEEFGEYYAFALLNLNSTLINTKTKKKSDKIRKQLELLIEQINEYPKINNPDVDLIDKIQNIRVQYKKLKAMLKIKFTTTEENKDNNTIENNKKDLTF